MPTFGQRIKQIRTEKKIMQKTIAEYLGLNVRTYQYYETDKLEPNLETLNKLAEYFQVSVDYLLGRPDIKMDNLETINRFRVSSGKPPFKSMEEVFSHFKFTPAEDNLNSAPKEDDNHAD